MSLVQNVMSMQNPLWWILFLPLLLSCSRQHLDDAGEQMEEQLIEQPDQTEQGATRRDSSKFMKGLESSRSDDLTTAEAAYRETVAANKFAFEAWYNLGLLLYKQDRLDEAKEAFLQVANNTRASRFHRVHYQLGLIAADEGNDASAISYYEESQLLDPSHAPSYVNMAAALMRMKQYVLAVEQLDHAQSLDPGNPNIYWNRGLIALRRNEEQKSEAFFLKVVELDPSYAPALFNLGLAAYRKNNLENAQINFHKAAWAKPNEPYPEAHYMLGKVYSKKRNFNAAINEYEIALEQNPGYIEAAYNLALNLDLSGDVDGAVEIYRDIAKNQNAPPEALNNLAAFYLRTNEPDRAVELLERATTLDPLYSTASYNLGLAWLKQGNLKEAVDAFIRTCKSDPDNFASWKNLGIAYARTEAYPEALEAMQKAFNLNPADADTAVYLVKYLKFLNKQESTITDVYRKAYGAGARNPLLLRHLASAAFAQEDFALAASLYEECLKFRPTTVNVYNYGLACLRMDDIERSIKAFNQAVQLDPGHFPSWKNLGIAYSRGNDLESALEAMQKAFVLDPSDADTAIYVVKYLKLLGYPEVTMTSIYQKAYESGARDTLLLRHLAKESSNAGDYDAAAAYYAEYLLLKPSAPYYFNLGLSQRKANRFNESREAYMNAVSIDPDYAKAWLNLGYVEAFLNDETAARNAFQKALEIDPQYENAHSAMEELNNGQISP